MRAVLRDPLAWLPTGLSLAAMAELVGYVMVFGVTGRPDGDEGAAARVFQLLLLGAAIATFVFVIRWLPREPRAAGAVVVMQAAAAAVPIVTILLLESGARPG